MLHVICLIAAIESQGQANPTPMEAAAATAAATSAPQSIELDEPAPCAQETAVIDAIEAKYGPEEEQLSRDGDAIEKRYKGTNHLGFDVTFKEQRYAFKIPQVSMKPLRMSLNIPSVSMKVHKITFKVPVSIWVEIIIGWRPVCRWTHCHMQPIKTKVPSIRMENRSISTSTPEVSMRRTDIVTNVPKIRLDEVDWIVKIPEIKARNPIPEEGPSPEEGDALKKRGDELAARIQEDSATAQAALSACLATDISQKRNKIAAYYDAGVAQLSAAIDSLKTNGIDPSAVETDSGVENYTAKRDGLIADRDRSLAELDDALKKLQLDEQPATPG